MAASTHCAEWRVREIFKQIPRRNPLSGHEWTEHGPTTGYEVVGPAGPVGRHRSEAAAQRAKAEWQAYFERLSTQPK